MPYPMPNPWPPAKSNYWPSGPVPQESPSLIRVDGFEGAKAYPVPPNATVPLFDGNEDVLYVKSADPQGFPTIRTFRFQEVVETPTEPAAVSREEFDNLKKMVERIANAKQPVPEQQSKPAQKSQGSSRPGNTAS